MLAPSHPRVLVADDQQDVVAALRMLLRGAGLEVDPATSIQEVRHRLDSQTYDLVLMDLNYARDTTSGLEGLDLLTEIRERDRLLPVIVMTGWGSLVGDGYGDLWGEPWKSMPKDSGVLKVFALP